MNVSYRLACVPFVVFACASLASAQRSPPAFKAYEKALRDRGYYPVLPMSTVYKPGYIYKLDSGMGNISSATTVCENAFEGSPVTSNEAIPTGAKTTDKSFKLALGALPALVGDAVNASLGIDWAKVKKVELALDGIVRYSVSNEITQDPSTAQFITRKFSPLCEARLRRLKVKTNGDLVQPLYVVVHSYTANKLQYKLEGLGSFAFNLGAEATSQFTAKTGWNAKKTDNQTLSIENAKGSADPYYFAAFIRKISRLTEIETVSPGQKDWNVKLSAPTTKELTAIPSA